MLVNEAYPNSKSKIYDTIFCLQLLSHGSNSRPSWRRKKICHVLSKDCGQHRLRPPASGTSHFTYYHIIIIGSHIVKLPILQIQLLLVFNQSLT